jgi:hypothetical protein
MVEILRADFLRLPELLAQPAPPQPGAPREPEPEPELPAPAAEPARELLQLGLF